MTARTVLTAFYGINIKKHNDPYVALMEGPPGDFAKSATGLPGLVVRLFLYFHPHFLPSVCSVLPVIRFVEFNTMLLLLSERAPHAQELPILVSRNGLGQRSPEVEEKCGRNG
jgi:hypothetical protein